MKLPLKPVLLAGVFSLIAVQTHAADFAAVPITGLPGLDSAAVAWGDYDNDGLLDFLVTGTTNNSGLGGVSQLWRNTGSAFTNVPLPGVPGVVFGSASWADYDRDGDLDFLLTGTTNGILTGTISQLWRNDGGAFVNVTGTVAPGLPQVSQSSVTWGDFDNNGTPDLLISGSSPAGRIGEIWRNTGSGFTNATSILAPGLSGVDNGAVLSADYDNDGLLDFLITGETSTGRVAQIWHNTGTHLTNATATLAAGLPGVAFSAAAWGDFDNDGRLDFALTGSSSTGRVAQLWRNMGTGFTDVTTALAPGLVGLQYGSAAWADYNNDGRLDLLLTGNPATGIYSTAVWTNSGAGFADAAEPLTAIFSTSTPAAAWGDYDNDGRIDLILTGTSLTGGVAQLWHNLGTAINTPPAAPSDAASSQIDGITFLRWSPALDAQSGSNVSYNLRLGTTPGGTEIIGASSDLATGFRRLPALGNAQLGTNALVILPPGNYYWSVQAVDGALAGGAFMPEQSFQVSPPVLSIARSGANVILSWQPPLPGWILQETSSLAPAIWTNSVSGSTNPIAISGSQMKQFFRLHKP